MKVEVRNKPDPFDRIPKPAKLVLICENEEESQMLDAVFGDMVQPDGLIAVVDHAEVRLSDGYREHYICVERDL